MFKKIKTVMMIMLVIGMTMLMSSAGCDNAADSGSGSSNGGSKQQVFSSSQGSTLTITYDNPEEYIDSVTSIDFTSDEAVYTGSFTFKINEADKDDDDIVSEGHGTWTLKSRELSLSNIYPPNSVENKVYVYTLDSFYPLEFLVVQLYLLKANTTDEYKHIMFESYKLHPHGL